MELRPMSMREVDRMLEWKNYPETRKFAIVSHDEIKRKDHLKWLSRHIKKFRIILWGSRIAGAVRVEGEEISIWIDRKFWNRGIATKVIKEVSKKGYKAKIVEGNIPSMRAFIKSGYVPSEYLNGYYIFRCTI